MKARAQHYLINSPDKPKFFQFYKAEHPRIQKSVDYYSNRANFKNREINKGDPKRSTPAGTVKTPKESKNAFSTPKRNNQKSNDDTKFDTDDELENDIDFYLFMDKDKALLVDSNGKPVKQARTPFTVSKVPSNKFGSELKKKILRQTSRQPSLDEFKDFYDANKDQIELSLAATNRKKRELKDLRLRMRNRNQKGNKVNEELFDYFVLKVNGKKILVDRKGVPVKEFSPGPLIVGDGESDENEHIRQLFESNPSNKEQIGDFASFYEDNQLRIEGKLGNSTRIKDSINDKANKQPTKTIQNRKNSTKSNQPKDKNGKGKDKLFKRDDFDDLIDYYVVEFENGKFVVDREGNPVKSLPEGCLISHSPSPRVEQAAADKLNSAERDQFAGFFEKNKGKIDQIAKTTEKKRKEAEKAVNSSSDPLPPLLADAFVFHLNNKPLLVSADGSPLTSLSSETLLIEDAAKSSIAAKLAKSVPLKAKTAKDKQNAWTFYSKNKDQIERGLRNTEVKKARIMNRKYPESEFEHLEGLPDYYLCGDIVVDKQGKPVKSLPEMFLICDIPETEKGHQLKAKVDKEIENIQDIEPYLQFKRDNEHKIQANKDQTEVKLASIKAANMKKQAFSPSAAGDLREDMVDYYLVESDGTKVLMDKNANVVKSVPEGLFFTALPDSSNQARLLEAFKRHSETNPDFKDAVEFCQANQQRVDASLKFAASKNDSCPEAKQTSKGPEELEYLIDYYVLMRNGRPLIINRQGMPVDEIPRGCFVSELPSSKEGEALNNQANINLDVLDNPEAYFAFFEENKDLVKANLRANKEKRKEAANSSDPLPADAFVFQLGNKPLLVSADGSPLASLSSETLLIEDAAKSSIAAKLAKSVPLKAKTPRDKQNAWTLFKNNKSEIERGVRNTELKKARIFNRKHPESEFECLEDLPDFYLFEDGTSKVLLDKSMKPVTTLPNMFSVFPLQNQDSALYQQATKSIQSLGNKEEHFTFYLKNRGKIETSAEETELKLAELKQALLENPAEETFMNTLVDYYLIEESKKYLIVDRKGSPVQKVKQAPFYTDYLANSSQSQRITKNYRQTVRTITNKKDFFSFFNANEALMNDSVEFTSSKKPVELEFDDEDEFEDLIDYYIFDDAERPLLVDKKCKPVKAISKDSVISELKPGKRRETVAEAIEQIDPDELLGFCDFFAENADEIRSKANETKAKRAVKNASKQRSLEFRRNLESINNDVDFEKIDYFVVSRAGRKLVYSREGTLVKNINREKFYIFEFPDDSELLSRRNSMENEEIEQIEDLELFYMFYENEQERIIKNIKYTKEEFFTFDVTNQESDINFNKRKTAEFEEVDEFEEMNQFYLFTDDGGQKIILDEEGNPVERRKKDIFTLKG